MKELPPPMPGHHLDDCWEVVDFLRIEGVDDSNVIHARTDMREPVGNRKTGLSIPLEGAQDGDYGPLHFGLVVAESDSVDDLPGILVVFRVEGINVTHTAAHEEHDHRFCLDGKFRFN